MKYKEGDIVELDGRRSVVVGFEYGGYNVVRFGSREVCHVDEEQIKTWVGKPVFHVPDQRLCEGCSAFRSKSQTECHRCIHHCKFIDLFRNMEIPKL